MNHALRLFFLILNSCFFTIFSTWKEIAMVPAEELNNRDFHIYIANKNNIWGLGNSVYKWLNGQWQKYDQFSSMNKAIQFQSISPVDNSTVYALGWQKEVTSNVYEPKHDLYQLINNEWQKVGEIHSTVDYLHAIDNKTIWIITSNRKSSSLKEFSLFTDKTTKKISGEKLITNIPSDTISPAIGSDKTICVRTYDIPVPEGKEYFDLTEKEREELKTIVNIMRWNGKQWNTLAHFNSATDSYLPLQIAVGNKNNIWMLLGNKNVIDEVKIKRWDNNNSTFTTIEELPKFTVTLKGGSRTMSLAPHYIYAGDNTVWIQCNKPVVNLEENSVTHEPIFYEWIEK